MLWQRQIEKTLVSVEVAYEKQVDTYEGMEQFSAYRVVAVVIV